MQLVWMCMTHQIPSKLQRCKQGGCQPCKRRCKVISLRLSQPRPFKGHKLSSISHLGVLLVDVSPVRGVRSPPELDAVGGGAMVEGV